MSDTRPPGDTEARQRITEIRRWRDRTAHHYQHPHDRSDSTLMSNVKAWWRDVDVLLDELDRLRGGES